MKGFPENEVIKRLKETNLTIPNSRILDIEYIDFEFFKKLLKDNHIKIAKYEKYWNRTKAIGNSMD